MSFYDHLFRLGYASDLHKQLKGMAPDCSDYAGNAVYQVSGIVMLLVSLVFMLNYYYGLFNNPRFTHRRTWLVNILAACSITGAFAYIKAIALLPIEKHCADLHFTSLDCALFAFNQVIYTIIICIIFSLLFKWKSVANKKFLSKHLSYGFICFWDRRYRCTRDQGAYPAYGLRRTARQYEHDRPGIDRPR